MCDCRAEPTPELETLIARAGASLEIRGDAGSQPDLVRIVSAARDAGWGRISVRTNGIAYRDPARARRLAEAGVGEVVFFLAAERASRHDRITHVRGALEAGLGGARALAAAGLPITLEIPVLGPAVQDLIATIDVARAAAHTARRVRLYSPSHLDTPAGPVPPALLPPPFTSIAPVLIRAARHAEAVGLELELSERDGIPLCAFRDGDRVMARVFSDRGARPIPRRSTSQLAPDCGGCASRSKCTGVTALYVATHGSEGLRPFSRIVTEGTRVRVRPGAAWDEARRATSRTLQSVVIRPTVDCNQDCWFCSANETSRNVESDPGRMVRKIVRLAGHGVRRISFSGGEPTLAKSLVDYVATARQAGIDELELVTNGVLLDRPEKVRALVAAGLTHVFLSLHAHDEALSREQTRKVGDHARTVRAMRLFAAHPSITLKVNHLVTTSSYRSLVRFVDWLNTEVGPDVGISFAYVTPQYKALDHVGGEMPRYDEIAPYLRRAVARAHELGHNVTVGSRQGVPPCILGELAVFSDVTDQSTSARVEDRHQKVKAPQCTECRFDAVCFGVWAPYAALHGTSELRPVPGVPVTLDDEAILARGTIEEKAEARARVFGSVAVPSSESYPLPETPPARARHHLHVVSEAPDVGTGSTSDAPAPLRVALLGTGPRARIVARAIGEVDGIVVAGVASPHALDKVFPEVGANVPRAASLESLLDATAIDAVVVCSSTRHHAEAARAASARGLPALVEKPLASSPDEADALASELPGLAVMHQMRMAGGFRALLDEIRRGSGPERVVVEREIPRAAPEALRSWSRSATYETFIHLGDLIVAALGGPVEVRRAVAIGDARPERISVRGRAMRDPRRTFAIELRFADLDRLTVSATREGRERIAWIREPGRDEIVRDTADGTRSRSAPRGGDLAALLGAWRDAVRHGGPMPVDAMAGVHAMRLADAAVRALETAGAPFDATSAPRHASSKAMREHFE